MRCGLSPVAWIDAQIPANWVLAGRRHAHERLAKLAGIHGSDRQGTIGNGGRTTSCRSPTTMRHRTMTRPPTEAAWSDQGLAGSPLGPCAPWGPRGPAGPGGPAGPAGPACPVAPTAPAWPAAPVSPFSPLAPAAPGSPGGPSKQPPRANEVRSAMAVRMRIQVPCMSWYSATLVRPARACQRRLLFRAGSPTEFKFRHPPLEIRHRNQPGRVPKFARRTYCEQRTNSVHYSQCCSLLVFRESRS